MFNVHSSFYVIQFFTSPRWLISHSASSSWLKCFTTWKILRLFQRFVITSCWQNLSFLLVPNLHESSAVHSIDHSQRASVCVKYFRDRYFSGPVLQPIISFVTRKCARLSSTFQRGKIILFCQLLEIFSSRFFIVHCSPNMLYRKVIPVMRREYDSPTQRATVQARLETLRS